MRFQSRISIKLGPTGKNSFQIWNQYKKIGYIRSNDDLFEIVTIVNKKIM